ncbi:hypothetical protein PVAG01_09679 [Phlyctema vagabunda]|uniref:CRIB domain-containing protein n=1 Tax=Phlyctema vagabunda TaxID=108571 RepID=A0ABR4P878_9HELO
MFGFNKTVNGPSTHPHNRNWSRDSSISPHASPPAHLDPTAENFEAAIDGPPSPERIRAYTEQMKRSSIFGNNSRTHTFSSTTSSFRSGDSSSTSVENLSLSRKSSVRSNSSSMFPSEKSETGPRLGKTIFSRTARKLRRESNLTGTTQSMNSLGLGGSREDESTRERGFGKSSGVRPGTSGSSVSPKSRRPVQISGPSNFQHVTHTRQEHLPNLARTSRMELASEFTAIRASQAPTNGELKGIRAQDLHFENFSSETIHEEDTRTRSQRQAGDLRIFANPPQPSRARSHDMLRSAPPRPPRSPLYQPDLPARTSSRTASTFIDKYGPLPAPPLERPQTSGGFRRPAPLNLRSPLAPQAKEQQQEYFSEQSQTSHAVTTPNDEAWPLTGSSSDGFGILSNVPEEEETMAAKRQSRHSVTSGELRLSQSVPALRLLSRDQSNERPGTGMSTTSGKAFGNVIPEATPSPLSPGFRLNHDSWEDDIDYCYEHEAEANCDYQWDRCSFDLPRPLETSTNSTPEIEYRLQDSERTYHGRFRPSLLVPSAYDIPALSPMSHTSMTESDPRTPNGFLRPAHLRTSSYASSFKESHGFHLSPSLLIPSDFGAQMEQERVYDELDQNDYSSSATIFPRDSYSQQPASPIDETTSSAASFRSSAFSRGSARSSSSTRMSANPHASQESILLLNAGCVSQAHRSIGSASSLPDLIPSGPRRQASEISLTVGGMTFTASTTAERDEAAAPGPEIQVSRRKNSLVTEPAAARKSSVVHSILPVKEDGLSPVTEAFVAETRAEQQQAHGRKVSAPVVTASVKEFKGRARAATHSHGHVKTKSRGSYMLFPSTAA